MTIGIAIFIIRDNITVLRRVLKYKYEVGESTFYKDTCILDQRKYSCIKLVLNLILLINMVSVPEKTNFNKIIMKTR